MSDRRVLLTESSLEDIADAIREKRSVSDTWLPSEMAGAIRGIPAQGHYDSLTATLNGEYLPSGDVDAFDAVDVRVQTFTASVDETAIILTGEPVSVDDDAIVIDAAPKYIEKTVTADGEYFPADDGADAYTRLTVATGTRMGEKTVTANGDYTAGAEGLNGYSRLSVRVEGAPSYVTRAAKSDDYPFAAPTAAFTLDGLSWPVSADDWMRTIPVLAQIVTTYTLDLTWTSQAN